MINIEEIKQEFINTTGSSSEEIRVFFAPGRVNLIGEHTDYNDGFVMPFSLKQGTWLLVRQLDEPILKFSSKNFALTAQVCLKKGLTSVGQSWVNYPLGVINEFQQSGKDIGGMEMLFVGNIPNEAGLSSSASVEMVTAIALNELFDCKIDRMELVKMGQRAENDFVGMNCGIMDQFAVTMGKENHAVYLNCGTLDWELIPFELGDYVVVICNTNKKRGLADSKYNERRAQCEQAVKDLNNELTINSLSDINEEDFKKYGSSIKDPVVYKRARHVVTENSRVLKAGEFLKKGDLISLGQLMSKSHTSLRDDYEVSCRELDLMVELADSFPQVLGSRMTGAGFGGCSISLVPRTSVENFIQLTGKKYESESGLKPDFYIAKPGEGAMEVTL